MPVDPAQSPALFCGGGLVARSLQREQIPALQAFYEANPEYFLTINGQPPKPDAAAIEFDEVPPPHLSYERQWCIGIFAEPADSARGDTRGTGAPLGPVGPVGPSAASSGSVEGVLMLSSNLCMAGVWHLGLFIVATRLHGRGAAHGLHAAMEDWVRANGAAYLRLGVVKGNARAERFWEHLGYVPLREREGVDTGGRINTLRVMLKPLRGQGPQGIAAYLQAMPRDQPGSALP